MRIKRFTIFTSLLLLSTIFYTCGTSTGSRFKQEKRAPEETKKKKSDVKKYPEDFNFSNYHPKFDIKSGEEKKNKDSLEVWYEYHNTPVNSDTTQNIVKTVPGYRVQVLVTDNLDEANQTRSDIYFKTNLKAVYIVFDPPFYKVEVGDFKNMADAKSLGFQLKQLGYSDARVINETINIF